MTRFHPRSIFGTLLARLAVAALASLSLAAQAALKSDPARLSIDVKLLSSDAFEGREPGTRAETRTVLFIEDRMREAGLQPGGTLVGGRRGWTQDVPLAKFTFPAPPSLSLKIGARAQLLLQGQQVAIRAPQTNIEQLAFERSKSTRLNSSHSIASRMPSSA